MSSSLPPDPYRILGVSKDAQLPEIRSAHRKLVLKCHPDKVQDPTLKAAKQDEFQKVQQAYELLSDENERLKYDDNVKLAELRKEMAAKGVSVSANTSASRSAPRTYDINIRTAEPRADTFKTSSSHRPSAGAKMYAQYNSRSYDEDLHRANPIFEEPRARRATSYEKTYQKTTRSDEERDRERERERERDHRDRDRDRRRRKEEEEAAIRKEREKAIAAAAERERLAEKKAIEKAARRAAEEKELRRQHRKAVKDAQDKADKERDRERKQALAEKTRSRKPAYVEPYGGDETYLAKDKKPSKKTKEEEKRSRSIPRDPIREDMPPPPPVPADRTKIKFDETMFSAAEYMDKSRRGAPSLGRSQTFAGFEPPLAAPTPPNATPFVAPPPPPPPIPTSDDDVRRSKSRRSSEMKREKSSHKKSPAKDSPYVVEASPTARPMAHFPSTHSSPMGGSPPKGLSRSSTFDPSYVRPPPGPARAQTFHYGIETDSRGRNRSRLHPQSHSEESESEDDPRPRRSHRQRVDDAIPLDYGPRSTKYAVDGARAVPIQVDSYYREQSPTRKYYDARPPMTRESSAYSGGFPKVKTTARYAPEDIQYSNIPHRYRDSEYAF